MNDTTKNKLELIMPIIKDVILFLLVPLLFGIGTILFNQNADIIMLKTMLVDKVVEDHHRIELLETSDHEQDLKIRQIQTEIEK